MRVEREKKHRKKNIGKRASERKQGRSFSHISHYPLASRYFRFFQCPRDRVSDLRRCRARSDASKGSKFGGSAPGCGAKSWELEKNRGQVAVRKKLLRRRPEKKGKPKKKLTSASTPRRQHRKKNPGPALHLRPRGRGPVPARQVLPLVAPAVARGAFGGTREAPLLPRQQQRCRRRCRCGRCRDCNGLFFSFSFFLLSFFFFLCPAQRPRSAGVDCCLEGEGKGFGQVRLSE